MNIEWVEIPAGEFWMGTPEEDIPKLVKQYGGERWLYEDESPRHKVVLPAYAIARTPVTNAQYELFVRATWRHTPRHWEDGRPPKGKESHPVVHVTWRDAMAYCGWLSEVTGRQVRLPSEAEWEKAARGDEDAREYPWGDTWEATRCNSGELGLGDTTPVGIFPEGASPYGCLDTSGNVWEWCQSLYKPYPYDPTDGREDLGAGGEVRRVLRGGSWVVFRDFARVSYRNWDDPDFLWDLAGFRVVWCIDAI